MTVFIVFVYLVIVAWLGYMGYRRTQGASDYLVAGRQIHPYVMALSYGATFISTSAIVGFGGAASVFGMGILWLTFLNIFVGIFIAFVFFGKRTRVMGYHMQAHTFPEFLAKRFDSPFIQKFAGLIIFLFMPLYAGVVLIGAARFLEAQLSVDYTTALFFFALIIAVYVIMGGLKGVMYTDAFQGTLMFVGMFVLLIYTYSNLGGVIEAHSALTAMKGSVPEKLVAAGHQGWTAMPTCGSPYWWVLVSTIVMGVGIGVLAQPQLVVRFMTVRSGRELNRAIVVGGIFILMMTGVAFITGALSNVYFAQTAGKISIAAAGGDPDKVIPLYITQALPGWFGILFMLTLLAAAMSTLSSQFHAMGTAIGRDFYQQLLENKEEADQRSVFISKMGIGITILVSLLLAYVLPKIYTQGEAIIARGTAIFFGLCAAAFLPAYLAGLYWRGATRAGAVTGMVGGFAASALWILFVHAKESSVLGLCQALFGKPALFGPTWQVVDPMIVALPISAILTILVSIKTEPFTEEHLKRCYR
ncbi:MAG: sodium:solute symporter family protein [Gemmatimonadota bacterium]